MKPVKVLYFVDGVAPSPEETAEGMSLNAHVCFRNARAVPAEGALEDCDGVAGKVPPRYAEKYPAAAQAIEARAEKLAKLAAKAGDVAPPKEPEKTPEATQTESKPDETAKAGDVAKPAGSAWTK